ncbi:MAG: amidophosphoribosyltransferase [Bacteriovoracaceae bacterium]
MCGIIGIQGTPNAASEVFQALLLLQHRGQDAAGILSYDPDTLQFHLHKEKGLVSQVFDEKNISYLQGTMAIGHTRYATIAAKNSEGQRDLQPMLLNYPHGVGLVHNGNIVNMEELTKILREKYHRIMLTKNDAETLLNMISTSLQQNLNDSPIEQLKAAASKILDEAQGGYSLICLLANGYMIGLRDPHGIRPLVLGKKGNSHILVSETNVIDFLGYEFVRDILPGELITISQTGEVFSSLMANPKPRAHCMFEWVYFATPESMMEGSQVYETRLRLGKMLGQKVNKLLDAKKLEVDVVIPVPESGRIAAIALSEMIHRPYRELLIKNRYIQRSFILKDQASRNKAVQLKLMFIKSEIKNKRVMIVDDSIVRGTTSKKLIEAVREAGAKEVHFVSTCPPIKNPCYFGIDFPLKSELIAAHLSESAIADALGADSVIYQDLEGLKEALNQVGLCVGCITGVYPFDVSSSAEIFEQSRREATEPMT